MKHTVAINVLKDELDLTVRNVKILRAQGAKNNFIAALYNTPHVTAHNDLRYRRMMKELIEKGNSLLVSIQALERDET